MRHLRSRKLLPTLVVVLSLLLIPITVVHASGYNTVYLFCKAGQAAEVTYWMPGPGASAEVWQYQLVWEGMWDAHKDPPEAVTCKSSAGCMVYTTRGRNPSVYWIVLGLIQYGGVGTAKVMSKRCY